jgi:hypothetical protein
VDTNADHDNERDAEDEHRAQYQTPSVRRSVTSYATSNDEEDAGEQSENEVPHEFVADNPKEREG